MVSLFLYDLLASAQTLLREDELLPQDPLPLLGLGQLLPEHAVAGEFLVEVEELILVLLPHGDLLHLPEYEH